MGTVAVSAILSKGEICLWTRIGEDCTNAQAFEAHRKEYDASCVSSIWQIFDFPLELKKELTLLSCFKTEEITHMLYEIEMRLRVLTDAAFGAVIAPLTECYV